MVKHNNEIPYQHFHKDWDKWVKVWFDQPGRKRRRHLNRNQKAMKIAPRPIDVLRPVVHPPTQRYNMRERFGRGFTLEELKAAKISAKMAPTIGISVDHRRHNDSMESLNVNVDRLKEYQSKLILFPRRPAHPKKGDSPAEDCKAAKQMLGPVLPIKKDSKRIKARVITEDDKKNKAFLTLRRVRADVKYEGQRKKRAAEAAEKAALKSKLKK